MNVQLKTVSSSLSKSSELKAAPKPQQNKITEIVLPLNVHQWRSQHVQGWLAFRIELPEYLPGFQEGSVDGLLLLRHIDDVTLKDVLKVSNSLHRKKILEGISLLQEQQTAFETKLKQQVKEKSVSQKKISVESDAEATKNVAPKREKFVKSKLVMKPPEDENKIKRKKRKVAKKILPSLPSSDIREKNEISRVIIETKVKQFRKKNHMDDKPMPDRGSQFEYSLDGSKGTTIKGSYKDVMAGLLESDDLKLSGILLLKPISKEVKKIPPTRTTDEIIDIIKKAMLTVSKRLVDFQRLHDTRKPTDDDLYALETSYEKFLDHAQDDDGSLNLSASQDSTEEQSDVEESEIPPAYDEAWASEEKDAPVSITEYVDEESSLPPPAYDQVVTIDSKRNALSMSHNNLSRIPKQEDKDKVYDNVTLVYEAFLELSNDATWLGKTTRLTRLKFMGGIENILKIRMSWGQFGALWTRIDKTKTGEITLEEFKDVFGSIALVETLHSKGTGQPMAMVAEQKELLSYMYKMCDVLRHAGFTVAEIFDGFDRTGTGNISINDFCSLLKVVLGHSVDKRIVYKIMSAMDQDGGKSISRGEMSTFIYYVWRSELQEISNRIYLDTTLDDKELHSLIKEKEDIKNAIIRNFPRSWREKVSEIRIDSPFTDLFEQGTKMLADQKAKALSPSTKVKFDRLDTRPISSSSSPLRPSSPSRCRSPTANMTSSLKMHRLKHIRSALAYSEKLSSIGHIAKIDGAAVKSLEEVRKALSSTV
jgi:hypothetical protein